MFFFLIFTVQWWLTLSDLQCFGMGVKRETQAPKGWQGLLNTLMCTRFLFFFFFHSIANFFFSLIHLYLICWLNTWLVLLTRQEHELEDEDVVQIIKKVWVLELGTIEQPTVERIFEHRVRLLLWDLFYIIPSYSRPKQSMSSLFHLEIR